MRQCKADVKREQAVNESQNTHTNKVVRGFDLLSDDLEKFFAQLTLKFQNAF